MREIKSISSDYFEVGKYYILVSSKDIEEDEGKIFKISKIEYVGKCRYRVTLIDIDTSTNYTMNITRDRFKEVSKDRVMVHNL